MSISRRARASAQCVSFARCSALVDRIHPHHVAIFGICGSSPRPLVRLGSGSLSLAILPARSLARRHSCGDPGGLGHLSGSAWARSGGDPGPLDRCLLLTDVVFKDDASVSAHVASSFPTRCESRRFHASDSLRRSGRSRWSVVLSRRRSAGVPLMPRRPRARPGRAMSAGVGPRSQAISGRNPKA